MFGMGMTEVLVIGALAVLLFGKQLPEVAKTFGKTYFQFREGLNDLQREMRDVSNTVQSSVHDPIAKAITHEPDDYEAPSGPKFELPEDE